MTLSPYTGPLSSLEIPCFDPTRKDLQIKRKRYTEEQIIAILREAEAGIPVADLCRKLGVYDANFYRWRAKYGGMEVSDAKKLRQLEAENVKLKQLLADAMPDKAALDDVLSKKW